MDFTQPYMQPTRQHLLFGINPLSLSANVIQWRRAEHRKDIKGEDIQWWADDPLSFVPQEHTNPGKICQQRLRCFAFGRQYLLNAGL